MDLLDYGYMIHAKNALENNHVSKRAREPDGFYTVYIKNKGKNMDEIMYPNKKHSYLKERENYLKRVLPTFYDKPSYRRWLSLIAWAFLA